MIRCARAALVSVSLLLVGVKSLTGRKGSEPSVSKVEMRWAEAGDCFSNCFLCF